MNFRALVEGRIDSIADCAEWIVDEDKDIAERFAMLMHLSDADALAALHQLERDYAAHCVEQVAREHEDY